MFLLETHNIEKSFGAYKALDDVSIGVREGAIFGLLGPNGAGKTTLIRLINRISRPDKGTLLIDGHAMTDADVREIGYLPEERGLYKKMAVGEQAVYLAQLKGLSRREATQRLRQWFDRFEIGSWWNRPVEELSKGMQQKVQFIVTVLHEPRLLIFDEPFSGFDPVNATLLKNEILALRDKGATVVLSTHNMASVEELCDDIVLINKSKVVLTGGVKEIKKSYSKNVYEMEVDEGEVLRMTLKEGQTANDLLKEQMDRHRIVSFREILPSMNDIFIETVAKGGAR